MWGLLAGLLTLTALDVLVSKGGSGNLGSALGVVQSGVNWLVNPGTAGIPDLSGVPGSGQGVTGTTPAPGQGNPNLTGKDYALSLKTIFADSKTMADVLSTFGIVITGTPNPNLTANDYKLTIGQIEAMPRAERNDVLSSFGLAQG